MASDCVSCIMRIHVILCLLGLSVIHAFVTRSSCAVQRVACPMFGSVSEVEPLAFASGYSQAIEMTTALQEAVDMALEALPCNARNKIDLAVVSVSSLYDGNAKPSDVVPTVLQASPGVQNLIGCTNGGFISSLANLDYTPGSPACRPIEREGVPGVTVTFMVLPDVSVSTFHVLGDNVPENDGKKSPEEWKEIVGLKGIENDSSSVAMIFPSPAFQPDLKKLLRGLEMHITPTVVGAIASTVSSLSRARLFRYSKADGTCVQTLADGCVGVVLSGDIQVQTMVAQGAKPVSGVYQIVKGQESTIAAIALDEVATEIVQKDEGTDDDEEVEEQDNDSDETKDARAKLAQAYAKACIPKPVLAEANMVMKTLSDDDQAFMKTALLVGLQRTGGRTPSDLVRLTEGKGPGFTVHQVASAGVKDGSVTFSLGVVNIKPGQRLRFYVREPTFAKKEARALWTGYKQRILKDGGATPFAPAGCFVFPTLDRGNKFFLGKSGFESSAAIEFVPTVPSISGFFGNGVIARLDSEPETGIREQTSLSGSASGYFLFGSKTGRPIYVPSRTSTEEERDAEEKATQKTEQQRLQKMNEAREERIKAFAVATSKAPRDEFGELVLRRREVHSGRAMTVSTVEWSVADKIATPTSAFEGFMWDKETEVDRFRERVPLANLVSQCRLIAADPSNPKPRDWLGPIKEFANDGSFVIIPECKRMEPGTGSLRKRYDLLKLTKEFTVAGVPAISVNCDGILFGGTLDDITKAREGTFKAAAESFPPGNGAISSPPILASDLLLYPYQLYQLRLAGADAVNLIVAALEAKDLVYLAKIATSLQMQTFVTVTSTKQIEDLGILPAGSVKGLIVSNRNLEDFSFDLTGRQALDILNSKAMEEFREKHGDGNIAILVEGRIGLVTGEEGTSPQDYIKKLKEAGAIGAIVGTGLVADESKKSPLATLLQTS